MRDPAIPIRHLEQRKAELLDQINQIDDDLQALGALADRGEPPVVATDFLKEKAEFEWLIGGLIARQSVTMVASEAKVGKSTVLTQLTLCLATGQPFLGFNIPKTGRVLYVMAEGSRPGYRHRLEDACKSMGISSNLGLNRWFIQPAAMSEFSLRNPATTNLFRRSGADLIVLDTLGYFTGFADENDSSAWKKSVMAPLRALIAELKCSFILVHHYGKMVPGRKRWERGRGSSAMFGDVDQWLGLENVELTASEEESLSDPEKQVLKQRRDFFVEKCKYGLDDRCVRLNFLKHQAVFVPV